MYLIGFFASPLPYIALLALYASGFAFMGLRGLASAEDMAGDTAPKTVHLPEICEFAPSEYTFFYPSSDGPEDSFTDRPTHQTIRFFPARASCHKPGPPENLRSATLTAHPIRPPPVA
jgi:hypothetical protein